MKIGLRVIKTGIAVFVSILLGNLLGIEYPFYTVIAVVIVMQPTVIDTWKFGMNRMMGTTAGAVLGVILALLLPHNPIVGAIGFIALITLMNWIKKGESISIGAVVFASVYLSEVLSTQEHIRYAGERLFETFLGIMVAVAVNYLVFPPNYDQKVIVESRKTSKYLWKYSLILIDFFLQEEKRYTALDEQEKKVVQELEISEKFLELQRKEEEIKIHGEFRTRDTIITLRLEREIYQHLQSMHQVMDRGIKKETMDLVELDMKLVREMLGNIHNMEEQILNQNIRETIDLEPIIEKLREMKKKVKNHKDLNRYPTDEMIKLIVFIYNLEQSLSKINLIPDY